MWKDGSGRQADDAVFGRGVVRVDHVVNFTWGTGRLTETATDFVSIRWHGRYDQTQCSHDSCFTTQHRGSTICKQKGGSCLSSLFS